jgi:hypothetical protein
MYPGKTADEDSLSTGKSERNRTRGRGRRVDGAWIRGMGMDVNFDVDYVKT